MVVVSLIYAIRQDLYPQEYIEGYFGIKMANDYSRFDVNSYPTGVLMYNTWVYVYKCFKMEIAEQMGVDMIYDGSTEAEVAKCLEEGDRAFISAIQEAVLKDNLPSMFREMCEKYKDGKYYGRRDVYLDALKRRNYSGIEWKRFQP